MLLWGGVLPCGWCPLGKEGWCVHGCLTSHKSPDGLSIHQLLCVVCPGQALSWACSDECLLCTHCDTAHTNWPFTMCIPLTLFSPSYLRGKCIHTHRRRMFGGIYIGSEVPLCVWCVCVHTCRVCVSSCCPLSPCHHRQTSACSTRLLTSCVWCG